MSIKFVSMLSFYRIGGHMKKITLCVSLLLFLSVSGCREIAAGESLAQTTTVAAPNLCSTMPNVTCSPLVDSATCNNASNCIWSESFVGNFNLPTYTQWQAMVADWTTGSQYSTVQDYLAAESGAGGWPADFSTLTSINGTATLGNLAPPNIIPALKGKKSANAFGVWLYGTIEKFYAQGNGYIKPLSPFTHYPMDIEVQYYADLYDGIQRDYCIGNGNYMSSKISSTEGPYSYCTSANSCAYYGTELSLDWLQDNNWPSGCELPLLSFGVWDSATCSSSNNYDYCYATNTGMPLALVVVSPIAGDNYWWDLTKQ